MDTQVKNRIETANKLIFVKQYTEAEKILLRVTESGAGRLEPLAHLRLIELASKLGRLPRYYEHYLTKSQGENPWPYGLCLALVELFGEMTPAGQIVGRLQEMAERHGEQPGIYYALGLAMEAQQNLDRAQFCFERAVALDGEWYPAMFNLSQIHYSRGNEQQGDHFFFQFEKLAPHNVYGNFDTHKALSAEMLDAERYVDAERAIEALSEWWIENRGACPPEIQVYESLALARISESQGDRVNADGRLDRARVFASVLLESDEAREGQLFFAARSFEEFGEIEMAFKCYKRIVRVAGGNPLSIQKIGGQFLSAGEFQLAKEFFDEAYEAHPDHPEIRFARLVASLKLAKVNVEDYLIGRERLRQLTSGSGDRVELLALLHNLLARFQGDPDVHAHIAAVYVRLGNVEKAGNHFRKMIDLDGRSTQAIMRYASFLMQHGDPEDALAVLEGLPNTESLPKEHQADVYWLRVTYCSLKKDYTRSMALLDRLLAIDPWNISYIVQEVVNLSALTMENGEPVKPDEGLLALMTNERPEMDWRLFDNTTDRLERGNHCRLVRARRKLRFLFADGSSEMIVPLVKASVADDAEKSAYEFLRLLNTNFDSVEVYWAIGSLFKELWQLETASMWFAQMIRWPDVRDPVKALAYIELADCLVWRNHDLATAVEYAKLAIDLGEKNERSVSVLAHAYLRSGQIRAAQLYLDQQERASDPETGYLMGLLHYRNGDRRRANEIWKPLLRVRSESLRFHHIKQEILKFYYEGKPYHQTALN